MKKLYFTSMLLGMVLASTSCEDNNKSYTDEFASVLNYKQEGIIEFDFYRVNRDVTQIVTIGKGGHDLAAQPRITLIPFTQEEMDDYNKSTGSTFKLLPPEYYTLPDELSFEAKELYKNVDVVFKGAVGELVKASNYLLPIRLLSNTSPVNENKNLICLRPNVITPSLCLKEPSKMDVILSKEEAQEKIIDLTYYLDLKNEWVFSINFENDEDVLAAEVAAYNSKNDGNYTLLPQGNRAFASSLPFTANVRNSKLEITLDHEGLELGDYLLPIIPTECVGMPFDVSKGACYIQVMVTEQLPKIDLKEKMLKASSTVQWGNEGIKNVLDDNTETHWQSIWTSYGGINTPLHDPTYGVYIDISLTDALRKQIALDYTTRQSDGNAVPDHIVIYAGTSATDLKQIGELDRVKDGLPMTGDTKYSSRNFSLKGQTKILRLAILTQYIAKDKVVGNLTDNKLIGTSYRSVVISELALYGK